jgi:hypothetical protein
LLEPAAASAPVVHVGDTLGSPGAAESEARRAPPELSASRSVAQPVTPTRALADRVTAPVRSKRLRERNPNERLPRAVALASTGSSPRAGLDAEVELVDELRAATARKDWLLARQLIERHRLMFPEGQLGQEVAALAALHEARAVR